MLIYPAVDLRGGVCVRLLQGRFDAVTRYDEDPLARLEAFAAAGARWVHIVDLDGAEAGAPRQHALIGDLARRSGLSVQAGGGVRTSDDIARLLDAGVERVVVGSAPARDPDLAGTWLQVFGRDAVTLALDVRLAGDEQEVVTHGWTQGAGLSLWSLLDRLAYARPVHLLVTDVARDGALTGPNLTLMREIVARHPALRLQASGGVSKLDDLGALARTGAAAAIVGKALYEGVFTLQEALRAG
jgi:phosphoribosylformimino-5-aminoimidazole carboxamide ribotide isomerase